VNTYTLNAIVGEDSDGNPVYQEFVIEAANFAEARHQLAKLVKAARTS
jgi:hypothetical protein